MKRSQRVYVEKILKQYNSRKRQITEDGQWLKNYRRHQYKGQCLDNHINGSDRLVDAIGIQARQEVNEALVERLENAIAMLNVHEATVIKSIYIDCRSLVATSLKAGYTKRECKRYRRIGVEKLCFALFGIDLLQELKLRQA